MLRLAGLVIAMTFTVTSCASDSKGQALSFAQKACTGGSNLEKLENWGKARHLDDIWTRAAEAYVDVQVFQSEMKYLSQFLGEDDAQFRDVSQKLSQASLTLMSECMAIKK